MCRYIFFIVACKKNFCKLPVCVARIRFFPSEIFNPCSCFSFAHLLHAPFLNIEFFAHSFVIPLFTILSNPESKNKLDRAKHVASNDHTLRWISTSSSWILPFFLWLDSFLKCSQVWREYCEIQFFQMQWDWIFIQRTYALQQCT